MGKDREACGRCSMSVAVDVANADTDAEGQSDRNPYGEARIEVEEDDLRTVSPDAWLSALVGRLDDVVQRLVWGQ